MTGGSNLVAASLMRASEAFVYKDSEVLKKVYYNNKCPALTYVQRGTFLEMDTSAVKSDKVLKNKIRA